MLNVCRVTCGCVCAQCAAGAGVFELQVLEFSNYRLQLWSGACCGGAAAGATGCARACRTRFALCLKEYQSAAAPGACSFGRAASPVLGTDSFTLADPLYTLALPFSFRWTVRSSSFHTTTDPECRPYAIRVVIKYSNVDESPQWS